MLLETREPSESVRDRIQPQDDQVHGIRKPAATDDSEIREPPATDQKSPDDQEYRPTGIRKPPVEIRRSGRARKSPNHPDQLTSSVFLTHKEQSDLDLAIKLRAEGKIKARGELFKTLIKEELNTLRALGVFKVV